jgi:hypothetical protein
MRAKGDEDQESTGSREPTRERSKKKMKNKQREQK